MERQIMINHRNSKELTDLLTQLKEHDVRQVGSVERTDNWRSLADSGLNKAPMNDKNYSYGIVISTLPNIDFHTTKLSHEARVSRCYEYHGKSKDNVIGGQKYYDFIQDLSSKISLPKCWKFMFPEFIGFAMEDAWPGSTDSYYGGRGRFELCKSLSLAAFDPDKEKIKTKREYEDSNEDSKDVQESLVNINCLEVIAIYPDKKVLEKARPIGGGLVKSFLTYHPDYQFQWSKAAETHAFIKDEKIRRGKIQYGSPPIDE